MSAPESAPISAESGQVKPPSSDPAPKVVFKGITLGVLIVLIAFVGAQAHSLWMEWRMLQVELDQAVDSTIVGYPNIFPIPSYAHKPSNWFRVEKDAVYLWSGWKSGVGHRWFQVGKGEIARSQVSEPIGRDVQRAIDAPAIEVDGGQIWDKIPPRAQVVGLTLEGLPCAYPVLVLSKVGVVNDVIDHHPYLLLFNGRVPSRDAVSIFNPLLNGVRVTLGCSGYFLDGKPVFYDRATESLWVEDKDGVTAIAGKCKGSRLPRVAKPVPVAWSTWKEQNPHSRLLIGAETPATSQTSE